MSYIVEKVLIIMILTIYLIGVGVSLYLLQMTYRWILEVNPDELSDADRIQYDKILNSIPESIVLGIVISAIAWPITVIVLMMIAINVLIELRNNTKV